jgi:hypothetical protein
MGSPKSLLKCSSLCSQRFWDITRNMCRLIISLKIGLCRKVSSRSQNLSNLGSTLSQQLAFSYISNIKLGPTQFFLWKRIFFPAPFQTLCTIYSVKVPADRVQSVLSDRSSVLFFCSKIERIKVHHTARNANNTNMERINGRKIDENKLNYLI